MMIDASFNEQNKLAQKIREFKSNTKPRNHNMIKENQTSLIIAGTS